MQMHFEQNLQLDSGKTATTFSHNLVLTCQHASLYYLIAMEGIPLLKDIIILMGVSIPVIIFFHRLGMPIILGFITTGIIIGPSGFGLITEVGTVELLAQVGVVDRKSTRL